MHIHILPSAKIIKKWKEQEYFVDNNENIFTRWYFNLSFQAVIFLLFDFDKLVINFLLINQLLFIAFKKIIHG